MRSLPLGMTKWVKILLVVLVTLVVVYLLGPIVSFPTLKVNALPQTIADEGFLKQKVAKEKEIADFKQGNHSQVIWADSSAQYKTEYVVLFLHGFSASPMEGMPVVSQVAKTIGANMYAPLLAGHGSSSKNTFEGITPQEWIDSAVLAYQESRAFGSKVIIASSSTGSTLSILLAAHFPEIHSLLMYSPNIDLADKNSDLILKPWGKQILELIMGGSYNVLDHYTDAQRKYWNDIYHTDGIVALKYLLNETMIEDVFKKVNQGVFLGCYYKNESEQDHVVSVKRMRDFLSQIATVDSKKKFFSLPEAKNHVLTSDLFFKDNEALIEETLLFLDEGLGIKRQ